MIFSRFFDNLKRLFEQLQHDADEHTLDVKEKINKNKIKSTQKIEYAQNKLDVNKDSLQSNEDNNFEDSINMLLFEGT